MHFPCAIALTLFVVVLSTFGCEQLKARRFTMCKFYLFYSFSQIVILSLWVLHEKDMGSKNIRKIYIHIFSVYHSS